MHSFYDGIPLESDYRELIKSNIFTEMEKYSEKILSTNKNALLEYIRKWVEDPLHQWSRQWEYPFVFNKINEVIQKKSSVKILDAGSGVTFFPYYVKNLFEDTTISCCDFDNMLTGIYQQININEDKSVEFSHTDLRELPYESESFDMIYCISVLEHTDDYEKIIEGFYKILRPGGILTVTIDISLDGTRDIDVIKGTKLLNSLDKNFDMDSDFSLDLKSHISIPGIFTTQIAANINPVLLPWKYPSFFDRLKAKIVNRQSSSWPPPLTVFCLNLTKPST
jgi:SAM-dependent methyltransferase